jgi:hypothetical protein
MNRHVVRIKLNENEGLVTLKGLGYNNGKKAYYGIKFPQSIIDHLTKESNRILFDFKFSELQSIVRFYKKSKTADFVYEINEKNKYRTFEIGENAIYILCLSSIRPNFYQNSGNGKMKLKFSLSLIKEGKHFDEYKIISEQIF